jgi:hypothetical protein
MLAGSLICEALVSLSPCKLLRAVGRETAPLRHKATPAPNRNEGSGRR